MASVEPLGNYDTQPYVAPDGAEHTVYTVPAAYLAVLVTQIRCTDDGGTARTIGVIARIGGVDYTVAPPTAVIPANDALDIELKPLVLKTGDSIKATASASGVHVLVSFAVQSRRS